MLGGKGLIQVPQNKGMVEKKKAILCPKWPLWYKNSLKNATNTDFDR